jgi:hypothetical protein
MTGVPNPLRFLGKDFMQKYRRIQNAALAALVQQYGGRAPRPGPAVTQRLTDVGVHITGSRSVAAQDSNRKDIDNMSDVLTVTGYAKQYSCGAQSFSPGKSYTMAEMPNSPGACRKTNYGEYRCDFVNVGFGVSSTKSMTLVICAIFRNEAPYLREWIEFHQMVGAERFYLYQNMSDDDWETALRPYIETGIIEVAEWPRSPPGQLHAYQHFIDRHKGESWWTAFIDCDEFLFRHRMRLSPGRSRVCHRRTGARSA